MVDLLSLFGMGSSGSDPGSQLALRAHDDAAQNANNGSTSLAAPDWSSMQQAQPMPVSAQAAQAQPAVATGGGGLQFGNPMNGDPLISFGQQDPNAGSQINPDYGVSQREVDRANRRAMMQSSIMMLAAGLSTDEGARANLLGKSMAASDPSEQLGAMAKIRLETAKSLIEQQKAQAAVQQRAALVNSLGLTSAAPGPATAPTPTAAPASPMTPVVGPASSSVAAGRIATGTGNAADQAIMNGISGGPADPNQASPIVGAGDQNMVPGGLPDSAYAPAPALAPPSAAPLPMTAGPGRVTLLSKAPDSIDVPTFDPRTLPMSVRQTIAASEKPGEELGRYQQQYLSGSTPGQPVMLDGSDAPQIPLYSNLTGRLMGYKEAGKGTVTSEVQTDDQGNKTIVTKDARGNPTSITPYEPDSQKQSDIINNRGAEQAQKNSDALKTDYKDVRNAGSDYQRMSNAVDDIDNGLAKTGPDSFKASLIRAQAVIGNLSDEQKKELLATDNANTLSTELVGKFAKQTAGARVDNADLAFAKAAITGGGSPIEVKQALQNQMQATRNQVNDYNDRANDHNGAIDGLKSVDDYSRGRMKVPTVQGDFGVLGDQNTPKYATPQAGTQKAPNEGDRGSPDTGSVLTPLDMLNYRAAAAAQTANPAPTTTQAAPAVPTTPAVPAAAATYLRANPGLKADFDRKYGPGAAASVLGG